MAHATELFLDNKMIEMAASVTRKIHRPTKHSLNPVVHSEKWWEGNLNLPYATLYDQEEKCFKMWLRSGWDGTGAQEKVIDNHHGFMTYLTSKDGVHWERPELGLMDFGGRRAHPGALRGHSLGRSLDVRGDLAVHAARLPAGRPECPRIS